MFNFPRGDEARNARKPTRLGGRKKQLILIVITRWRILGGEVVGSTNWDFIEYPPALSRARDCAVLIKLHRILQNRHAVLHFIYLLKS